MVRNLPSINQTLPSIPVCQEWLPQWNGASFLLNHMYYLYSFPPCRPVRNCNWCQNSKWTCRMFVSIVLFSSAFLYSQINPLSFHGRYQHDCFNIRLPVCKEALKSNKQNDMGKNTTGWINNCFSPWKEFFKIKLLLSFFADFINIQITISEEMFLLIFML